MKTALDQVPPYPTKDGSEIRELMHPGMHAASHGAARQSLAEARLAPGQATLLHRHRITEEIYHLTAGRARMTLGERCFAVEAGDTICIPPGTPHRIENTGDSVLTLLCMCAPAYAHEDTELMP